MKPEKKAMFLTAAISIVVGCAVAGIFLLLVARENPNESSQVSMGLASSLKEEVSDGGPLYFAGLDGKEGIWIALENKKLVALGLSRPDEESCHIKWRDSKGGFIDCHGNKVAVDDMTHYATAIAKSPKGAFVVDLKSVN